MFKNLDGVSSCVWEQMDTGRYVYYKIKRKLKNLQEKGAGGDEKHAFSFTRPYISLIESFNLIYNSTTFHDLKKKKENSLIFIII